ncbi:transposase, partial [Paenibacillus sp. A3]|uniref:transposase n=1 Tax=Paenibacillus sp. A3 TaxID=1337054 RepID=UPI0012FC04AA
LTGGQSHDCVTGYKMLKSMELTGTNVLADRAYDTNAILNLLQDQHAKPVIPSKNLAVFSVIVTGGSIKNATEWNASLIK